MDKGMIRLARERDMTIGANQEEPDDADCWLWQRRARSQGHKGPTEAAKGSNWISPPEPSKEHSPQADT